MKKILSLKGTGNPLIVWKGAKIFMVFAIFMLLFVRVSLGLAQAIGDVTIVTGDLDGNGQDEAVVDFGSEFGVHTWMNNSEWEELHGVSPETMITGDLNGDGEDEVIVDFGPEFGVFIRWVKAGEWERLHNLSPELMVTGDLDGNGEDEVIVDFGPEFGIWIKWYSEKRWERLHEFSPELMVTGDLDGNGEDEVIIDFGYKYGVYIKWVSAATWERLHRVSPKTMVTGDLDGNGEDEVIVDFGYRFGIWIKWVGAATWERLHELTAELMVMGDLDGNGEDEVIVDFGPQFGVWIKWVSAGEWKILHEFSPELMVTGDLDGTGEDEVVIDFGPEFGIWVRLNNTEWKRLHNSSTFIEEVLVKGANLPWGKYGYDIGRPEFGNFHLGFSSASGHEKLEVLMSQRQNAVVRVWLFCDLRAGIEFHDDGSLSFKDLATVQADMDALLESAENNNIRILPLLFDRTISVLGDAGGTTFGRHRDVITDPVKRARLIALFRDDFMDRYIKHPNIYAWDILNEPEVATELKPRDVSNQQQWDFIREFAEMIREKIDNAGSDQLVTTGNKERYYMKKMLEHWESQGHENVLSLYQFHYYNAMGKEPVKPLTNEEKALIRDVPVLIGELSASSREKGMGNETWTEITDKLDVIYQSGFIGGLFWHDDTLDNNIANDDHVLLEKEWLECVNWTPDVLETYYGISGRRESKTLKRPDIQGVLYYHYEDNDTVEVNKGRIDVVVYAVPTYEDAIALEYEYPGGSLYEVNAYNNANYTDPSNPVLSDHFKTYRYYYDIDGNLQVDGINFPYERYTITWADEETDDLILDVLDPSGKMYLYLVNMAGDPYTWGNYVGYRETWNSNLELYGEPYADGGARYQSIYLSWRKGEPYRHVVSYLRETSGWGAGGVPIDPKDANHPAVLEGIFSRPHVDPYN